MKEFPETLLFTPQKKPNFSKAHTALSSGAILLIAENRDSRENFRIYLSQQSLLCPFQHGTQKIY